MWFFFVVISNISPLLQFVTMDSCMCLCIKHGEFTFFWFRAVDEIEKSIEPDNTPTTRIYNNIYRISKKSPGGKWARSRDRERNTQKSKNSITANNERTQFSQSLTKEHKWKWIEDQAKNDLKCEFRRKLQKKKHEE